MNSDTKFFYYISSGELNRMYTLRVSYEEWVQSGDFCYPVIRDFYSRNLSTDKDKAYRKAKDHVENLAYGDCKLVDVEKVPTLEEISRREKRSKEELQRIAEETKQYAQEQFEERCYRARMDKIDKIECGRWPFGQYRGLKFGDEFGQGVPDYGYIKFFMNLEFEPEDNTDKHHAAVVDSLKNALSVRFGWLLELPTPNGNHFGEIRKRQTLELTLVEEFSFEGYYGFVFIQKFVKDSGECIVYKGGSPILKDSKPTKLSVGDTVHVKATIKDHEQYNGENQTRISRPVLIEKKEAA